MTGDLLALIWAGTGNAVFTRHPYSLASRMGLSYLDDLLRPTRSDPSRDSPLDGLPVPAVQHGATGCKIIRIVKKKVRYSGNISLIVSLAITSATAQASWSNAAGV